MYGEFNTLYGLTCCSNLDFIILIVYKKIDFMLTFKKLECPLKVITIIYNKNAIL